MFLQCSLIFVAMLFTPAGGWANRGLCPEIDDVKKNVGRPSWIISNNFIKKRAEDHGCNLVDESVPAVAGNVFNNTMAIWKFGLAPLVHFITITT